MLKYLEPWSDQTGRRMKRHLSQGTDLSEDLEKQEFLGVYLLVVLSWNQLVRSTVSERHIGEIHL